MKTFFSDILPKLENISQKLDDISLLTNKHWVSIDNITDRKTVYIFRDKNELLISTNGKIAKADWEYLGNKSLLIGQSGDSYLFKHGFFDGDFLVLKVDGGQEYAVFVNENNYNGDLNSVEKVVDYLKGKYLHPLIQNKIPISIDQRLYESNSSNFEVPTLQDIQTVKFTSKEASVLQRNIKGLIILILLFFSMVVGFLLST